MYDSFYGKIDLWNLKKLICFLGFKIFYFEFHANYVPYTRNSERLSMKLFYVMTNRALDFMFFGVQTKLSVNSLLLPPLQGAIAQLSEQISTLNDRMDEFTSRIEELNSKLTSKRVSSSPQNMALQSEACNGSAPTSYFISGLGNGSLTGSIMPNSLSSSQLAKEYPLMEEVNGRTNPFTHYSFEFGVYIQ